MVSSDIKALALATLDRGFNQGDETVWDEVLEPTGVDHQEPAGTDFRSHLRDAVRMLRTAFPDLHFEVHHALAEGEIVALHSTMTGTHHGVLALGPGRSIPPTGQRVSVRHMHFLRWVDGKNTDLWHVWDLPGLMRQLGLLAMPPAAAPTPAGAPTPTGSP